MKILTKFMDAVYPESIYCNCCESIIDKTRSYGICDKCISKINWATDKTCAKCGKVIEGEWQNSLCADCMEADHSFDKGITCAEYGVYTRTIVFSLKYSGKTYIAKDIAKAMRDKLSLENTEYDIIVPVPISKKKLKDRGFNQASLICRYLSKFVGKDLVDGLTRIKETTAQRGLGKIDRYVNLQGAFGVKKYFRDKLKGKKVLLVDDIYTTGSTVDQCSKALGDCGVESINVITFAAGGNRHNTQIE